jgi:hypothetical protein
VAVQPLTLATFQRDEVASAEDEIVIGDPNVKIAAVHQNNGPWTLRAKPDGVLVVGHS